MVFLKANIPLAKVRILFHITKNDEHFLSEYPLWAGARDVDDQGYRLLTGKLLHRQGNLGGIAWSNGREL